MSNSPEDNEENTPLAAEVEAKLEEYAIVATLADSYAREINTPEKAAALLARRHEKFEKAWAKEPTPQPR